MPRTKSSFRALRPSLVAVWLVAAALTQPVQGQDTAADVETSLPWRLFVGIGSWDLEADEDSPSLGGIVGIEYGLGGRLTVGLEAGSTRIESTQLCTLPSGVAYPCRTTSTWSSYGIIGHVRLFDAAGLGLSTRATGQAGRQDGTAFYDGGVVLAFRTVGFLEVALDVRRRFAEESGWLASFRVARKWGPGSG